MNPRMFALSAAFSVGAALVAAAQPSSVPPISYPVTQAKTYKFENFHETIEFVNALA